MNLEKSDQTELGKKYESEKQKIGLEFKHFATTEPKNLEHLLSLLKPIQTIQPELQALLREDIDVQAGQPYTEQIIKYEITPFRIIETHNAISTLLHRAQKRHYLPPYQPITLSPNGATNQNTNNTIPAEEIIHNIKERTMLPDQISSALYSWTLYLACTKPNIIRNYTAKPHNNNTLLLYPLNTI